MAVKKPGTRSWEPGDSSLDRPVARRDNAPERSLPAPEGRGYLAATTLAKPAETLAKAGDRSAPKDPRATCGGGRVPPIPLGPGPL